MMTWALTVAGFLMALIAGVFLGFSDFIMRGLAQASGTAGSAAMVGINRTVYHSIFIVLFISLLAVSVALALLAFWQEDGIVLSLVLAGSLSYSLGVFAVTGLGNVPMNNRLDAISGSMEQTTTYWFDYVQRWTRLNNIRSAASAFAAIAWLIAANQL
jgi:uncharacterized membrane protein